MRADHDKNSRFSLCFVRIGAFIKNEELEYTEQKKEQREKRDDFSGEIIRIIN